MDYGSTSALQKLAEWRRTLQESPSSIFFVEFGARDAYDLNDNIIKERIKKHRNQWFIAGTLKSTATRTFNVFYHV